MQGSHKGFTLVEMIVVIVIIGILGVGVTSFIGRSAQGVIDTANRSHVASVAWIVSEKLSREIRDALPNSFRLNAGRSCLEFVPTLDGTDYLSVPIASGASTFEAVPFPNYVAASVDSSQDRVAVYPSSVSGLYALADPGVISSTIDSLGAGTTANSIQVDLDSSHQFLSDSPTRRLFVVQNPLMFCFESGALNRYSGYGFQSSMPSTGSLTATVVANGLSNASFRYENGTLSRAGVVTFAFDVNDGNGLTQSIDQEVQVRNVP